LPSVDSRSCFMNAQIDIPKHKIAKFCQRNRIRRLALFGSVLHGDYTSDSEVDVLVAFEPDIRIGYIGLTGLEIELEELLGRKTDLYTLEGVERS